MDCLIKICNKIKYLISKKVVLQIALIKILEASELIHTILYLFKKKLTFHNVVILIKSVANKKENIYYYMFLEKDLYTNKSKMQYF